MANVRDRIRLTDDEVADFLRGRRTMTVATIGRDGRPHLVAMWYGFIDDAPAFETYAKSQKVVNLRRDPRITCLVESGTRYEELVGVELIGTGTVLEDPESVMTVARSVVQRYWDAAGEDIETMAAGLARKRVAVRVDIDSVVSWDHGKLAAG